MATHSVLVTMQRPDGTFWYRGQTVEYDGAPDWKLEPVEAEARTVWKAATAQPARVESERQRGNIGGIFEEGDEVLPPGTMPVNAATYPPSGWSAA